MTILLILTIVLLLMASAFFSASETAVTSASRAKLHQLAKDGDGRANIIRRLQEKMGAVISVVLTCNTMLNTLAAFIAAGLFDNVGGWVGKLLAPFIMGALILIYAEVMPKMVALYAPERFMLRVSKPLNFIFNLSRPLNTVITYIARGTLSLFGIKTSGQTSLYASLEELRGVIDMHQGPGQDVPQERAMLKSILDLGSVHIGEIMIHRKNVTMINADNSTSMILDQVLSCPFTRLPIYKGDPDNIIGMLNTKAVLRALRQHSGNLDDLDIQSIATKPWFVPESNDLLEQLQAFRVRREHFALVVDEFGVLLGIVTLEDILEEIVGEIDDEHDIKVRGVRPQPDGSYIIDGSVTIRDLNRQLEWDLPDEPAATIAGLLLHHVRLIPEVDQVFIFHNFRFQVLRRQRNQVTLIRVTPTTPVQPNQKPIH